MSKNNNPPINEGDMGNNHKKTRRENTLIKEFKGSRFSPKGFLQKRNNQTTNTLRRIPKRERTSNQN